MIYLRISPAPRRERESDGTMSGKAGDGIKRLGLVNCKQELASTLSSAADLHPSSFSLMVRKQQANICLLYRLGLSIKNALGVMGVLESMSRAP